MNQILSIEQSNKNSNKASINTIVLVFCVILIIFGIGITSTGAYSYYKNVSNNLESNKAVSNTKPTIMVERESTDAINIVVKHDKEISSVTYQINDNEIVEKNLQGETQFQEEIELPAGKSKLTINAIDINGMTSSYETEFEVEQKPKITLEQAENKIKAITESSINIDYIEYYWDDNEQEKQRYTINDLKNETLIDVPEGEHILIIIAYDINGAETSKRQKVIGDNKPIVKISTNGQQFLIEAEDDQQLSKIEVTLNSNETQVEEISEQKYSKKIDLEQGENKLTVKVYNINGISETSKVKFTKE